MVEGEPVKKRRRQDGGRSGRSPGIFEIDRIAVCRAPASKDDLVRDFSEFRKTGR